MAEIKETTKSGTVQPTSSATKQVIDIERLADKVYQLLCEETRLERARGETRRLRN